MKIDAGPWREFGAVRLGPDGKLMMPDPGPRPGIYQFRLTGGGAPSVYIGESEDISRRFGQYRPSAARPYDLTGAGKLAPKS
jgi:hypothetical protein